MCSLFLPRKDEHEPCALSPTRDALARTKCAAQATPELSALPERILADRAAGMTPLEAGAKALITFPRLVEMQLSSP